MSPTPLSSYQKRLFVLLSVATFFEGYDFIALAQVLPNLRAEMGLSPSGAGFLVAFINLGTMVAYVLVRRSDGWGRKRVLTITIAGYTIFTFLSGLAPSVLVFALLQFAARIFLIAEWAISMVYAAEEFPADRRGMVMGVIQGCSSLGSILCAGVVPLLLKAPWGWRTVYFVGVLPLILLAYARRNLQDTKRFVEQVKGQAPSSPFAIWRTAYAGRLLLVGLTWSLTYACTQNGVTFWKEFAVGERGMNDAQVAASLTTAAVASMPLIFFAGKFLDIVGRRVGALIIFFLGAFGILGSYTLHGQAALTGALVFGIFGATAVLPVLNAFTTELFPTAMRGDAWAWANNVLGRFGYVLAPLAVGIAAEDVGWGMAVASTAVGPMIAAVLIYVKLPETRGRELEETAQV